MDRVSRLLAGNRQFFFQLLLLIEAGVVAVESKQLLVPADLNDSAMDKHHDLVRVLNRRHAMRN